MITIKMHIPSPLAKHLIMCIKENVDQHSSCGILKSVDTITGTFSNKSI